MRKVGFLMVLTLLVLMANAGPGSANQEAMSRGEVCATVIPQPSQRMDLQPGVWEFIANTYLAHVAEFPDPNETVEVLRLYLEGNHLLSQGHVEKALEVFSQAVQVQPDSRHAHAGLGEAYWQRFQSTGNVDDLHSAVEESIRAAEIGMMYGKVRYTYRIAAGLATLRDVTRLDRFFQRALEVGSESYLTHLDYARGLAMLGDPRAGEWYRKTLTLMPEGNSDALAYYAEWFLDQGELDKVLELVPSTAASPYLHFLRGVALERKGQTAQARQAYERYASTNALFPAPMRYRIAGSVAQKGLYFEGGTSSLLQSCVTNISQSIYCEARGESGGGMRAVGWTIRNRVFIHTTANPCLNFGVSGTTLCDKYISAINRGFCPCADNCSTTPATNDAATDIYYGRVPETYTKWCPYGSILACDSCNFTNCRCYIDQTEGGRRYGILYMYGTSGNCPAQHPVGSSCTVNRGKLCGNGSSDNCFYTVP